MERKFYLVTGFLLTCVFLAGFVATWVLRGAVQDSARAYCTEKGIEYSQPMVDMAEVLIDSELSKPILTEAEAESVKTDLEEIPEGGGRSLIEIAKGVVDKRLTKPLLSEEQIAQIKAEIDLYQSDPHAYVDAVMSSSVKPVVDEKGLTAKFLSWRGKLAAYMDKTMDNLFRDLRIFTGSNLIASLFLMWIATKELKASRVLCLSLLISLGYGIFGYYDSMGFFTILLDNYMGWFYPFLLFVMFIYILYKLNRPA